MKSVRVRSFFGPYIPILGLITEIYLFKAIKKDVERCHSRRPLSRSGVFIVNFEQVNLRIQSEYAKIQTMKTPHSDTFQ